MGENTHISWAHHTFNPWMGCTKISPGCENCYAQRKANHRWPTERLWDPALNNRHVMAESTWKNLPRWNKKAEKAGVMSRLFVGSMCDIADPVGPESERARIFAAPKLYPWLTFMFLTKRVAEFLEYAAMFWPDEIPENVWFGFTAEDQQRFDERWAEIEKHYMIVPQFSKIFMSYEPAVGGIDMVQEAVPHWLDLVIAGGESGPMARAADGDWFRSMRDQCAALGIDFMFKQWGEYYPVGIPENLVGHKSFEKYDGTHMRLATAKMTWHDKKYNIPQYRWAGGRSPVMERVGMDRLERDGKTNLLDGRVHNGGLE